MSNPPRPRARRRIGLEPLIALIAGAELRHRVDRDIAGALQHAAVAPPLVGMRGEQGVDPGAAARLS